MVVAPRSLSRLHREELTAGDDAEGGREHPVEIHENRGHHSFYLVNRNTIVL